MGAARRVNPKNNDLGKSINTYKVNNKKTDKIRLRFAPSPTGSLHIGSARTALFNWLYARKTKGKLILRIEDTDRSRHIEEAIAPIIESLKWMGIDWDEGPDIGGSYGPYRQSERTDIYTKYGQKLVDEKKAYICFCTPDELNARRKASESDGKTFKYDRRCHSLSADMIAKRKKKNPYTIRILVPDNKVFKFKDEVYGNISVNSDTIEDYIILRSNGLPTYNFSVAIDDALMEMTHIIRGEDHLSNTPRQLLIYSALGIEPPVFAHLPMILGSDGRKLSKRHGSVSIGSYKEEGFLPEAIVNHIALLGWAYDEKSTIFSARELIEKFSLESINKKGARFDYKKLLWINGSYLRKIDDKALKGMLLEKIHRYMDSLDQSMHLNNAPNIEETVEKMIPLIKERIGTINESLEWVAPFFAKIEYSQEMIEYFDKKSIEPSMVLLKICRNIKSLEDSFISSEIEQILRKISEETNIAFRKIAEVLRIALWAKKVSPPLFDTMEILGYQTVIERIYDYLGIISGK